MIFAISSLAKRFWFSSLLVSSLLFSVAETSSYRDLEAFLRFKKKIHTHSLGEYVSFRENFKQQFSEDDVLYPEIQKLEPFFLIKEKKPLHWESVGFPAASTVLDLLFEEKDFDLDVLRQQMADFLLQQGKNEAVLEPFNHYIQYLTSKENLNPYMQDLLTKDEKLSYLYGWYFLKGHYHSYSDSIFTALLKTKTYHVESLFYLGLSSYEKGDYDKASQYLEAAIQNSPTFSKDKASINYWKYHYYYASLWKVGKKQQALTLIGQSCRKNGELSFCERAYRDSKELKLNPKIYEDIIIQRFPTSLTAYILQRNIAIEEIRKGHRENGLAILNKIMKNRTEYVNMVRSAFFDTDDLEDSFLKSNDLFYSYILNQKQLNPYPEIEEKFQMWLKEDKEKVALWRKTGELSDKLHFPWYVDDVAFKEAVFKQQSPFFKRFLEDRRRLTSSYEGRIDGFVKAGYDQLILREIEKKFEKDDIMLVKAKIALAQKKEDYSYLIRLFDSLVDYSIQMYAPPRIMVLFYPRPYVFFVNRLSKQYHVDASYIYAVMRTESHFKTTAISNAGAQGLMQLMPSLSKNIYDKNLDLQKKYAYDPFNPYLNMEIGVSYLSSLLKRFNGNEMLATIAYNAGGNRVIQWTKDGVDNWLKFALIIPIHETQYYVQKVLRAKEAYKILY